MPDILLLTGEISGDLYGKHLIEAIKKTPDAPKCHVIGGRQMRAVADHFYLDMTHRSKIGLSGVFESWKGDRQLSHTIQSIIKKHPIKKAILIDFANHSIRIAKQLKAAHIPVTTFITPNNWIWQDRKMAQRVAKFSDHIITIYEQEYALFKSVHPKVDYLGHPMTALVTAPTKPISETLQHITFYPGSRQQEIRLYLPTMLAVAKAWKRDHPDTTFSIISASESYNNILRTTLKKSGVEAALLPAATQSSWQSGDLLISCTGTNTLQAILNRQPLIVLAALSPLAYWTAKLLLRLSIDPVALVNIVAKQHIVPEFIQYDITVPNLISAIKNLERQSDREALLENYRHITKHLGKQENLFGKIAASIILKDHEQY